VKALCLTEKMQPTIDNLSARTLERGPFMDTQPQPVVEPNPHSLRTLHPMKGT